ncbi:MAG: hypothetical protein WB611_00865 [Stellaceae bacterium]
MSNYVTPTVEPSLEDPIRPDEDVKRIFYHQVMEEINKHQAACMIHGIRRVYYDIEKDRFHHRLSKRRRQSALHLIDTEAQREMLTTAYNEQHRALDDAVFFAMASSAEHIKFV